MARNFNVPKNFRSQLISQIKEAREAKDPRHKDLSPSILELGPVTFILARHFGFCFGVQNALEIAYRAIEENPNNRIFLLSEIIHNPTVNADLARLGVCYLGDSPESQKQAISSLTADDIVIVPAFGTTTDIQNALTAKGIKVYSYDTTCPFVKKVWKKADSLGQSGFTVVLHGKKKHEETQATFSHSKEHSPTLIIKDKTEALLLASYIRGESSVDDFCTQFRDSVSLNFNPESDLIRIGVVNQTTMLASETTEISNILKETMVARYGQEALSKHFADTSDTLCYATYENQASTKALCESGADIAIVVGGYNSSNTSHIVELCSSAVTTFFISSAEEIISAQKIRHFEIKQKAEIETLDWLPLNTRPIKIALTSGASCPDILIEEVIHKIASFFPN